MERTTDGTTDIDPTYRLTARLAGEFPHADPLASECVVSLVRTQILLADELNRRLRPYRVSLTGFLILGLLRVTTGPLRPSTIARWLRMTRGTVTGLLDSLEKRGLVRRLDHPSDRRMLRIELTDAARELQTEMVPTMFATDQAIVADLSVAERRELVRLLSKVQRRLIALGTSREQGGCPGANAP